MSEPNCIDLVVEVCPACGATAKEEADAKAATELRTELAQLRAERDAALGKVQDWSKILTAHDCSTEPVEAVLLQIRDLNHAHDKLSEIEHIEAERDALSQQLEADRTVVADCITKAKKELSSRAWMATSRGSYEWDDDKYQQEFGAALEAISIALDPLARIAADWTGCPKTSAEIAQARINLKQERDALKLELNATWRCFHCGFSTSDVLEATAHFGGRDEEKLLCRTWVSLNADGKIAVAQNLIRELDEEREVNAVHRSRIEGLEGRALASEEQRDALKLELVAWENYWGPDARDKATEVERQRDRLLILCGKMRDSFKSIRAWVNTAEPGELEQTIITVRTVSEIALQLANEVLGEVPRNG